MRKVDPKNEIPVTMLSDEAIEKRIKECDKDLSPKLTKKVRAIHTWLTNGAKHSLEVDVNELVKRVYKVTDEIVAETGKQAVCRKGCAHCCKVPVGVTALEAAYLHSRTGIEINPLNEVVSISPKDIDYCPLLDQETATCSVYQYRPLHCRAFLTIDDPKYCEESNQEHYLFSVESSQALKFLRSVLEDLSRTTEYAEWADIRAWVKQ